MTDMSVAKSGLTAKAHYGKNRSRQLSSLRRKMSEHKESVVHKAALKSLAEAEKKTVSNVLMKTLAQERK
jgi:hypothetical protein